MWMTAVIQFMPDAVNNCSELQNCLDVFGRFVGRYFDLNEINSKTIRPKAGGAAIAGVHSNLLLIQAGRPIGYALSAVSSDLILEPSCVRPRSDRQCGLRSMQSDRSSGLFLDETMESTH